MSQNNNFAYPPCLRKKKAISFSGLWPGIIQQPVNALAGSRIRYQTNCSLTHINKIIIWSSYKNGNFPMNLNTPIGKYTTVSFFCSCKLHLTYIQHTKPYDWLALLSKLIDEHLWTPERTTLSTRLCTAISHCVTSTNVMQVFADFFCAAV